MRVWQSVFMFYKYKKKINYMRNFSDILKETSNMKRNKHVVEKRKTHPIMEKSGELGFFMRSDAANKIINNTEYHANPDLRVGDNIKMKQLAGIFISQMKKHCGLTAYYHPTFKMINNAKSILFFVVKKDFAITLTPTMENGGSSVLRYYETYDFDSKNQTAKFAVSSADVGIVKMLGVFFDIINKPEEYAKQITEAIDNDRFKDAWEKGRERRFRVEVEDILKTGQSNLKNITKEGIEKLVDLVKNDKTIDPVTMAKDIINKTPKGMEYLNMLYGGNLPSKSNMPHKYCAVVQTICELANIKIVQEQSVSSSDVKVGGESSAALLTYNGVDVSFLVNIGVDYNEFKEAADEYGDMLDEMDYWIREFVEYTRMNRVDKLKNISGGSAIFISGIGGIGKSQTWEDIKDDMNLVNNKDYVERGNSTTNAKALYEFLYENNGKLLVFDDTPGLFKTDFAISFWKKVLEPKGRFPRLTAPQDTGGRFYNVKDCEDGGIINYRTMYYKECPKELDRDSKKYRNASSEEREKMEKESSTKYMPDEVNIMSKFIVISNASQETLKQTLKDDWSAIKSRLLYFEIAPPAYVIWAKIKQNLIKLRDNQKDDGMVPYQYVDEIVDIVEKQIKKGDADNLNFRIFADGRLRKLIMDGRKWKINLISALR